MQTDYYYINNLLQNFRVGKKEKEKDFWIEKEYKRNWFEHSTH